MDPTCEMTMLILSLFFILSLELDEEYQLQAPFLRTGIGEIGNWSLRGQAISQKKIIHLTSHALNITGGLCSRIPVNSNNWIAELELTSYLDTIVIAFSRYVCPDISRYFSGFNMSFVPQKNGKIKASLTGESLLFINTVEIEPFKVDARTRIKMIKSDKIFTVLLSEPGSSDPRQLFNITLPPMYDDGYFSVHAFSPDYDDSCFTDVHSFTYVALSERRELKKGISDINRKYMDTSKDARMMYKMQRRAKMLTVSEYIQEQMETNDILNGEINDFTDVFREIDESILRANDCISKADLDKMIETTIRPALDKAAARFERIGQALFHSKNDMISIIQFVENSLKDLQSEVRAESEVIEQEAQKMLAQMLLPSNEIKSETIESGHSILFYICIVEFILYIVFFIYQHRKMQRRKYY